MVSLTTRAAGPLPLQSLAAGLTLALLLGGCVLGGCAAGIPQAPLAARPAPADPAPLLQEIRAQLSAARRAEVAAAIARAWGA